MGWELLIPLIVQYGLPFAQSVFEKWNSDSVPTDKDFTELRALANQTALDRLKAQLTIKGIPIDSPQAVALIALLS